MSARRDRMERPARPAGYRLLLGLAVVALALLTTSNVLLWRLQDRARPTSGPAARAGAEPAMPSLPEPRGARAQSLADQFGVASRRFNGLLGDVRTQLRRAAAGTAPLGGLPPVLSRLSAESTNVSASLGSLNAGVAALAPLGAASRPLEGLPHSVDRLTTALGAVVPIRGRLSAVNTQAKGLLAALRPLNQNAESTRSAISDLTRAVTETNAELRRLRGCLETPVLCRTP